jgi:hypothetical protein
MSADIYLKNKFQKRVLKHKQISLTVCIYESYYNNKVMHFKNKLFDCMIVTTEKCGNHNRDVV